ncbi:MAG: site-specific integrase, partial [Actinomycetota bacterium]|nr:site-specific integrase [Actinomycetota bacterium]
MNAYRDFGSGAPAAQRPLAGPLPPSRRWPPHGSARHIRQQGDAAAWLAQIRGDQARGQYIDHRAGRIQLRDLAERFLTERVLAERTAETYRGLLDSHILPALGDTEIGQLTPATVRAWHAPLARQHPSTAAKAYRLLRTICNVAVADDLIARSPCRVAGAGIERAAARPIATPDDIDTITRAMPERYRALIQLATWCHLRKGELCALRRRDINLDRGSVTVVRNLQQLSDGTLLFKEPKTAAGRRTIAIPAHLLPDLAYHLRTFTGPSPDDLVFPGEKGGPLRPHVLHKHWARARAAAGRDDLHLHDLRHTGNTWAAATGASTRELMAR